MGLKSDSIKNVKFAGGGGIVKAIRRIRNIKSLKREMMGKELKK